MDGETRLENPILYPAHEQLALRRRPEEPANVASLVGHAAKPHAENRGDVIFQGLPAGQIIAGPGLRVTLDSAMAGSADDIGPRILKRLMDRLGRDMAHDVGHHRLKLADRAALALEIHAAVFVYHAVVLAVVVPHGTRAVVEHVLLE